MEEKNEICSVTCRRKKSLFFLFFFYFMWRELIFRCLFVSVIEQKKTKPENNVMTQLVKTKFSSWCLMRITIFAGKLKTLSENS